ncbi:hypothetical protein [Mucilaginibacter sp.]
MYCPWVIAHNKEFVTKTEVVIERNIYNQNKDEICLEHHSYQFDLALDHL